MPRLFATPPPPCVCMHTRECAHHTALIPTVSPLSDEVIGLLLLAFFSFGCSAMFPKLLQQSYVCRPKTLSPPRSLKFFFKDFKNLLRKFRENAKEKS